MGFDGTYMICSYSRVDGFNRSNPEHHMLMSALIMTSCDLSASCKTWESNKVISVSIPSYTLCTALHTIIYPVHPHTQIPTHTHQHTHTPAHNTPIYTHQHINTNTNTHTPTHTHIHTHQHTEYNYVCATDTTFMISAFMDVRCIIVPISLMYLPIST